MYTPDSERDIPRLVFCPNCKRRPMEIKKVELRKRHGLQIIHYVCSKCGHALADKAKTDSSA